MFSLGITVGKFMPFHLGHKHMIDTALDSLDRLIVLVSGREDDLIPLSVRYHDLCETYKDRLNIVIISHVDQSPQVTSVDENGTVLDTEFQNYWVNTFKRFRPTHFVSSDWYGKTMAELLGIRWFPVDPKRETYKISGTEIRNNFAKHFDMLTDVVKPRYIKKIAIVGPESVGKSTMTKMLAGHFNGIALPEYGRIISEVKNNDLDLEDFHHIIHAQRSMVRRAASSLRYPFVFTDTEAATTYLYSKIYLDEKLVENLGNLYDDEYYKQDFDLYLLLAPTVKWVDDGTRVMPNTEERWKFFNDLKEYLDWHKYEYVIIDEESYDDRWESAKSTIENVFKLTV
jgi:HTH-type transcriptional repressor of NAD biosynthesis genes